MLEVSTHHLAFKAGDKSKCIILKNVSQSVVMFKIKTNNIEVIDAKPNIHYLMPNQSLNVIVRSLKEELFNAKLQIISAQITHTQDIKTVNIAEELKKISKEKTKSIMINVTKNWVSDTQIIQNAQRAFLKKSEIVEQNTNEILMRSIHTKSSGSGFGVKKVQVRSQAIMINAQEQSAQDIKKHAQKSQIYNIEAQEKKEKPAQKIKQTQTVKEQTTHVIIDSKSEDKKQEVIENKVDTQIKSIKENQNTFGKQLSIQLNSEIKISIKLMLIIVVFFYMLGFLNGRVGVGSKQNVDSSNQSITAKKQIKGQQSNQQKQYDFPEIDTQGSEIQLTNSVKSKEKNNQNTEHNREKTTEGQTDL